MAEKIYDDTPGIPITPQPENLAEENLLANDTDIKQPIQAEENMEVHHHAHPTHGKKTWKNYFWEFLMLFLAVFCGFLAEYQLEHTIERDREKQYIQSMIADITEDSAKINASLVYCIKQLAGFDSLLQNIYHSPYTDSSLKMMYIIQLKYTHNRNLVAFTKRTITQLINSGGLRLIRNKSASDSVTIYNEECERAESQADYFEKVRMGKVNDYSLKLFDNQYILNYKGQMLDNFFNANSDIALLDNNEKLIKEYANTITYARGSLKSYVALLKEIQTKIPSKLKFLEEEYH